MAYQTYNKIVAVLMVVAVLFVLVGGIAYVAVDAPKAALKKSISYSQDQDKQNADSESSASSSSSASSKKATEKAKEAANDIKEAGQEIINTITGE